jgi:hypothetical protein
MHVLSVVFSHKIIFFHNLLYCLSKTEVLKGTGRVVIMCKMSEKWKNVHKENQRMENWRMENRRKENRRTENRRKENRRMENQRMENRRKENRRTENRRKGNRRTENWRIETRARRCLLDVVDGMFVFSGFVCRRGFFGVAGC